MTRIVEIQERLKELSAEMGALAEAENISEEQSAQYDAFEKEADELTVELEDLRAEAKREEMKLKAESIRDHAKKSTRVTAPNRLNGDGVGRVRPSVADDPRRGFKSLGHFAFRLYENHANVHNDEMLMQVAAGTGLTQAVNASGGVLVPPAFSTTIWDEVMKMSQSLLNYCYRLPVESDVESITVPAIAESSRADGSRWGGIRGYWKDELTQLTESNPTLRQVTLTPHELYVFAYISDKLLRRSPSTASALLEKCAADEIAFKIGDAIINGTGTGQPQGVVGHAGTKSVAKESGQAAATLQVENLFKMRNSMHMNFRSGAVWFINPEIEPELQGLEYPVGTGGVPGYLPPGGLSASPYSTLFGQPVVPIEYCAALGTVGDIIYGNFRGYATAVRGLVDSAYSMHLKFDYAQSAFRMIFEMDGQPFMNTTITPYKGSVTTAPIVTLATRS